MTAPPRPPLKVAGAVEIEETVVIVFVAGTDALTRDFEGVRLARPIEVRVPVSAMMLVRDEEG